MPSSQLLFACVLLPPAPLNFCPKPLTVNVTLLQSVMCVCFWGLDSCLQFAAEQIGHQMDPVDTLRAVSRQGALLGQHEQLLQALVENSTQMAKAII